MATGSKRDGAQAKIGVIHTSTRCIKLEISSSFMVQQLGMRSFSNQHHPQNKGNAFRNLCVTNVYI